MSDIPILKGISGLVEGQSFLVSEDIGLKIGRSPDNNIVLDDDGVSRFHVELRFDTGTLWLQDAGSRNGVFVNDNRIVDHKALKVNDEISIGDHKFRVVWKEDDEVSHPQEAPSKTDKKWYWPFKR